MVLRVHIQMTLLIYFNVQKTFSKIWALLKRLSVHKVNAWYSVVIYVSNEAGASYENEHEMAKVKVTGSGEVCLSPYCSCNFCLKISRLISKQQQCFVHISTLVSVCISKN